MSILVRTPVLISDIAEEVFTRNERFLQDHLDAARAARLQEINDKAFETAAYQVSAGGRYFTPEELGDAMREEANLLWTEARPEREEDRLIIAQGFIQGHERSLQETKRRFFPSDNTGLGSRE